VSDEPIVFVIDDDESVGRSVAALLDSARIPSRIFTSVERFLSEVRPETRGCVVTDVRMPEMSGMDLQRVLAERGLRLPVILMSGYGDVQTAVRAMKQGAVDFLEKPVSAPVLVARVRDCLGLEAVAADRWERLDDYNSRLGRLSQREREVMQRLVEGLSSRKIAEVLGISRKTVDVHRASIFAKTGFRNVAELIRAVMFVGRHEKGR
jgi:FixJ family two-component response regulator